MEEDGETEKEREEGQEGDWLLQGMQGLVFGGGIKHPGTPLQGRTCPAPSLQANTELVCEGY